MYVYMYCICVRVCMYFEVDGSIYAYGHVSMYVCMYVQYVYMYVYTHI